MRKKIVIEVPQIAQKHRQAVALHHSMCAAFILTGESGFKILTLLFHIISKIVHCSQLEDVCRWILKRILILFFPAPLNMKRNISINLDVSPMAASSKEERMKNAVNDRIASSLATNVARISLLLLQLHHLVSKTRIVPFLEPDAARRTFFPRSRPASQMSLIAKSLGQAAALENRLRALRTSRSLEIARPRRILP